jgi:OmpA-OmpF porin, OOP family
VREEVILKHINYKQELMNKFFLSTAVFMLAAFSARAQQTKQSNTTEVKSNTIPISNADLGTFPYFKTLPNFRPLNQSDSTTIEQNRTYFYDGKNYLIIDGKVSSQELTLVNSSLKKPSEFQIVQEFDKIVSTLGGKKIYAGKLPEDQLKKISGTDIVELSLKHQLAKSSFYGVANYVIKTQQKEVWIQLVAATIGSGFYTLMIVEKQDQLLTTNINKENTILKEMEKTGKATIQLYFDLDKDVLLTQSKDELLNIVGIFQAHPDWKIKIEVHSAPVGKPDYILSLTEKRAMAIKNELISLGVKLGAVEVKGLGDTKQLMANDTEKGRLTNTRVEILKL